MYLKADKDLAYEKVVDATDMAAKNGVSVVAMISDQKPGTTSTVAGDTKVAPHQRHQPEGRPNGDGRWWWRRADERDQRHAR